MSEAPAFRYVSCVPGKLVTRYGTGTYIGAHIDPATSQATFDEAAIVAIPLAEWATYVREYGRLLRGNDLRERNAADYESWQRKQAEASTKAAKDAAKAAKDAAKAATPEE